MWSGQTCAWSRLLPWCGADKSPSLCLSVLLLLSFNWNSSPFELVAAFSSHTLQALTDDGISVTEQTLLRYARICPAGEYCLDDICAALRVLSATGDVKGSSFSRVVFVGVPFASVIVHRAR